MTSNFDLYYDILTAENVGELRRKLKKIVPRVLGMEQGVRTKRNLELWVTREFLTAKATAGQLSFPLKLLAGDRPDICIVERKSTTGLEVAELIHPQTAKLRKVAFKAGIPIYSAGSTARSQPEMPSGSGLMRAALQKDPMVGSLYLGNEVETEMTGLLHSIVLQKIEKLNNGGFQHFNRNCLLLYDNSSLPCIAWERVDSNSICALNARPSKIRFDQISIVTGKTLIELL